MLDCQPIRHALRLLCACLTGACRSNSGDAAVAPASSAATAVDPGAAVAEAQYAEQQTAAQQATADAQAQAVPEDGFVFYKPWTWGQRMQSKQESWSAANQARNEAAIERNKAASARMQSAAEQHSDNMRGRADSWRDPDGQ